MDDPLLKILMLYLYYYISNSIGADFDYLRKKHPENCVSISHLIQLYLKKISYVKSQFALDTIISQKIAYQTYPHKDWIPDHFP